MPISTLCRMIFFFVGDYRTGSNHIREKDGIWAALAWLSVLEHTGKGVEDILKQHWSIYGRNYFTRYDYEECKLEPCNEMMATLEKTITDPSFIGKVYTSGGKSYKTKVADNFSYVDPVDKSVSTKQVSIFIRFRKKTFLSRNS